MFWEGPIPVLLLTLILFLLAVGLKKYLTWEKKPATAAERPDETDGSMILIDYCFRTVATVGGDRSEETVLCRKTDGSCEIRCYSMTEGDTKPALSVYAADPAVILDAFAIIDRNRMEEWEKKYNNPGPDGRTCTLLFRGSNGVPVRVTSNHMPEDGLSILSSVEACLREYACKGSHIE